MSKLVLVTPEGLVISDKKLPKVEKHQETLPLHVIAASEADKQSTTIKETK
jgi:hypothetical protein